MVKNRENEKERTRRFNVIWQFTYVHGNKEKDFHYVLN